MFDTIDHKFLLDRLKPEWVGISGTALDWFTLSLTSPVSLLTISCNFFPIRCATRVNTWSNLNFLYILLLGDVICRHISFHRCADDTQFYLPIMPTDHSMLISLQES